MELKRENPVKRIAILIGNNKWGGNFLPGVSCDMDAMKAFLLSPDGGAWTPENVFEIIEPISRNNLLQLLKKAIYEGYEYFFIYFGGHGELSRDGDPMFVLPGNEEVSLSEIKSALVEKPALMISDSCQVIPVYKEGGQIIESIKFFSAGNAVSEFKAQRMFDRAIRQLPPMFVYASAVSPGQSAADSSIGGLYTQSLLRSCKEILENDDEKGVYGIALPQTMAKRRIMALSGNTQIPYVTGYTRSYQPPFLVKL